MRGLLQTGIAGKIRARMSELGLTKSSLEQETRAMEAARQLDADEVGRRADRRRQEREAQASVGSAVDRSEQASRPRDIDQPWLSLMTTDGLSDGAGDEEFQPLLPWPFPDDRFPSDLGAVVMDSVLSGRRPTLQVVHFPDGYWGIADGVDSPNTAKVTATHIWHVIDRDPTIAQLATLPPGHQADRDAVEATWSVSTFHPATRFGDAAGRAARFLARLTRRRDA